MDDVSAEDIQLSRHAVRQIGHNSGVSRISDDAAQRIAFEAESACSSILEDALQVAEIAGRETVKMEDVELVLSMSKGGPYL